MNVLVDQREGSSLPLFQEQLVSLDRKLCRSSVNTLQINLGKLCNLACLHCHVEAGPKRTEIMTRETIEKIFELIDVSTNIECLDLTGGAPEMNPSFRWLVEQAGERNLKVIDRCNLTILLEKGFEGLAEFLAEHSVHIIASLPCYSKDNVDQQRGKGVFGASIEALKHLNSLGYASDVALKLDLVYNPLGASLPPSQSELEQAYKRELRELFDIEFNQLFTITNMPIKRFLHQLERDGELERYMDLLVANFNIHALDGVMCQELVSISWDGEIFDCDFNQMLELPVPSSASSIWDIDSFNHYVGARIAVGNHCYGCTAGAGSSCNGATAAS